MAKQKLKAAAAAAVEETEEVIIGGETEGLPEGSADEKGFVKVGPPNIEVEEVDQQEEEVAAEDQPVEPKADPNIAAIAEGFQLLREEIGARRSEPTAVPAAAEETEEEFAKAFDEGIFKDSPSKLVNQAVDRRARKIVAEEFAPLLAGVMESAFETVEESLQTDSIYKHFEPEVKRVLKTLPLAQQKNPKALKQAFAYVKAQHVDEVVEIKMAERDKVQPARVAQAARRQPVAEGGSTVLPQGARRVLVPKGEMAQLRRDAIRLGVEVEELVARRK